MSFASEETLLQTTCTHCQSKFSLTQEQLDAAEGKVRCSECNDVFDANINLIAEESQTSLELPLVDDAEKMAEPIEAQDIDSVSLSEAMNEGKKDTSSNKNKLYWSFGILFLVFIFAVQWVYFQRFKLIKNPEHQSLVLSVCAVLPCRAHLFKNTHQFTLLERNIHTHPTRENALLISGSFINNAPFSQQAPKLDIRLFNLNGNVIAQRVFNFNEYRQVLKSQNIVAPNDSLFFKINIKDPDTVTITYEIDFIE